jgi:hypothetical protein
MQKEIHEFGVIALGNACRHQQLSPVQICEHPVELA